jgi:hypothetical protein
MLHHPAQHRPRSILAPEQPQIRVAFGLRPFRDPGQGIAVETFDPQAYPSPAALAKTRSQ